MMQGTNLLRKLVVAGLVQNHKGEVLLTKRLPDKTFGGYWEFPGGKIEGNETPEEALMREFSEELGVIPQVGRIYDVISYRYPDFDLLMLVYHCKLEKFPTAVDVEELRFVHPSDFSQYQILPADVPILDRLQTEMS